ncbi:MAG: hypothetical protein COX62_04080 [Deltaproteobacteria bacterium CG_4_10_14_0_2_um_filter_43_8]|nr:MAG: hypothetical protein COV43_01950 [Deltaproteobacteria bacterium CG11_big_fil_rev_8_21_14_0_20_42_23]PJA20785.1 MAG: hypothetical protein COX62_04080 [Deltaproteobacteria bacterium CG_4_10_14_0_2_um_filter_43_8]PJC63876.1 MAG: hypothetical protein CO021_07130 [Deltaproteobacteria bacterium CG_4_9_14_0_2_um_filter_42_21]
MKVTHVHVKVSNLDSAVQWFKSMLGLHPSQVFDDCCVYTFGNMKLALDKATTDSEAIIALESKDCDYDYESLVKNGAKGIQEPKNFSTGSRAAILQGPGKLKIEIDQILS